MVLYIVFYSSRAFIAFRSKECPQRSIRLQRARVLAMAASSWRQGLFKICFGPVRLGVHPFPGVRSTFSASARNYTACPAAQAVVYHEHGEPDRVLK